MSNTLYWLWLQQKIGAGGKTARILEAYESVKAFYECADYGTFFRPSCMKKFLDKDLSEARSITTRCAREGYRILTPDDAAYPQAFKHMPDFPCVLYVQGNIDFNAEPMISIVGARKASYYGLNVATRLAYSLAKGGAVVVSGGAMGIDSAAHKGAVLAGGKTVMVLGSGLSADTLKEHAALRQAVLQSGALISEFPPDYQANRYSFPIRNRLIAALGRGTVVVQASASSGSLITADFAKQYGRDVYGVPGGIYNKAFQGVNELIRDGAGIVIGVEDILSNYESEYPGVIDVQKAAAFDIKEHEEIYGDLPKTKIEAVDEEIELKFDEKQRVSGLAPKTRLVYDCLETGQKHINEISTMTALSQREVLSELTTLELMDAVVALEGRVYRQC
ncbi:MAG: DNA-processing protein DprA [Clostridia bacterium]|nr:DNA-processing protein DprA [Clostridia bacterium]